MASAWVVYRYVGEEPMDWVWKRKKHRLVPGQFISRECYDDLGKGLTITQVMRQKEDDE